MAPSSSFRAERATQSMDSQTLVDWLCLAENHPDRPAHVELIETHISWVFLTRRYAYKLKKPVRFDFVDFSQPHQREHACQEEVRLNRRLTRSTYLGVVPITRDQQGELQLGGDGTPVDWLVKMWRLPSDRRLDQLVTQRAATRGDVLRIERVLAQFYEQAPPLTVRPEDYQQTLTQYVLDNCRVLLESADELSPSLVRRVHAVQLTLLELAPQLFAERVLDGRIVDGHGDLRPEHIYLMPEPVIVDCIEFSADFRRIDVADELCFLAMELNQLGAAELGEQLLHDCLKRLNDRPDPRLLQFYQSYRACVRAKVAALRSRQVEGEPRQKALREARAYLEFADQQRNQIVRPMLLAISGLMGTGKSTLAREVAQSLGWELLSTDAIRQEQFGVSDAPAGFGEGLYRPELRAQVYEEMFRRADELLEQGSSVVLDATFSASPLREQARQLADRHETPFLLVRCECPAEVARQRIAERLVRSNDASEARPELLAAQQQADDPLPSDAVRIDTTEGVPTQRTQLFRHLARLLWGRPTLSQPEA